MVQLSVLNASNNSLTHVEGVARLAKLKALILNHNKLKRIPHFGRLAELNTLGMHVSCIHRPIPPLPLFVQNRLTKLYRKVIPLGN